MACKAQIIHRIVSHACSYACNSDLSTVDLIVREEADEFELPSLIADDELPLLLAALV